MRGVWEEDERVFGPFLFTGPGSGYVGIYLEVIMLCFCFVHFFVYMLYFTIKKLGKTPLR